MPSRGPFYYKIGWNKLFIWKKFFVFCNSLNILAQTSSKLSKATISLINPISSGEGGEGRGEGCGIHLQAVFLALRRISCHGRNYSQPYFFKRNQSSDNRSHGFGAKFLLKKLSASDFSYEKKSAFTQKCEKNFSSNLVTFFIDKWEFKNGSLEKNNFLVSDFRNGISSY